MDRCSKCVIHPTNTQTNSDDSGQRIIEKTIRDTTGLVTAPESSNEKRKEEERGEENLLYFPSSGRFGHYVCPPQSHLIHRMRINGVF